jgi:hypothetical protein
MANYHPFHGLDHAGPDTPENIAERVEDRLNYVSECCGHAPKEIKTIDPRAWRKLLIYTPREVIEEHLKWLDEQDKKNGN